MSFATRVNTMLGHILVALKTLCNRLRRDTRGSVLPTFVLTLIPMLAAVGAAIDYTRASHVRAALQATLDSAVLAGAKDATSNWAQVALNTFNGNVVSHGSTVATPTFTPNNSLYTGSVTAAVPTDFGAILNMSSINVSVRAVGAAGSDPDGSCILTLDKGQAPSHVSM